MLEIKELDGSDSALKDGMPATPCNSPVLFTRIPEISYEMAVVEYTHGHIVGRKSNFPVSILKDVECTRPGIISIRAIEDEKPDARHEREFATTSMGAPMRESMTSLLYPMMNLSLFTSLVTTKLIQGAFGSLSGNQDQDPDRARVALKASEPSTNIEPKKSIIKIIYYRNRPRQSSQSATDFVVIDDAKNVPFS
jgi:hypothetical protein